MFKLDPSLGYVELIFDGPQSKPTTGWSVQPHSESCRVNTFKNNFLMINMCRLMNLKCLVLKGSATLILHHV